VVDPTSALRDERAETHGTFQGSSPTSGVSWIREEGRRPLKRHLGLGRGSAYMLIFCVPLLRRLEIDRKVVRGNIIGERRNKRIKCGVAQSGSLCCVPLSACRTRESSAGTVERSRSRERGQKRDGWQ